MIFGSLMIGIQGCSTSLKSISKEQPSLSESKGNSGIPESQIPPEVFGPPVPMGTPPIYGPRIPEVHPITLVLGPGLARGFAYIGVFRALHEAKIPIGAVFGTEMGGLIGALYCVSKTVNQFEWSLLKFKEDVFVEQPSLLSRLQGTQLEDKGLVTLLRQTFKNKDLKELNIPMRIGVQSKSNGTLLIIDQGNTAQAVRAALSYPPLFTSVKWPPGQAGTEVTSVDNSHSFLISQARLIGGGPIVVIDVTPASALNPQKEELKSADLVIRPELDGISSMSFNRKVDAAFRGQKAVFEHLAELKSLVGLSEERKEQMGIQQ